MSQNFCHPSCRWHAHETPSRLLSPKSVTPLVTWDSDSTEVGGVVASWLNVDASWFGVGLTMGDSSWVESILFWGSLVSKPIPPNGAPDIWVQISWSLKRFILFQTIQFWWSDFSSREVDTKPTDVGTIDILGWITLLPGPILCAGGRLIASLASTH